MSDETKPQGKPQAKEATVTVPVSVLAELQTRLASLELAEKQRQEAAVAPRAIVLDNAYEAWKAEAARPAKERTQDLADRTFRGPQRFRVWLDAGEGGPNLAEHFPLEIPAHSDLEAGARYLQVMGIRKHDYIVRAEPVNASHA